MLCAICRCVVLGQHFDLSEQLSQYYWSSIEEGQDFATQRMWSCNHYRPNMALGGFNLKQHLAMAA
jgi:putative transposase